jgi:tryptophan-rich sensory protein
MNTFVKLLIAVAVPLIVAAVSGIATSRGVATWYPTLVKPPFNPPSWIFGPVWTVLYVTMGVAAFLVWRRGLDAEGVRTALLAFAIQLGLNGLWSVLFFGMRSPGWALIEIVVLWLAILGTILLFRRVDPVAAMLLLPYLAWVSFAAVLNWSLWWLNRAPAG